ncbi:hypothetical protein PVK06_029623 [Gossypium arboreum]|uniref:Transposase-associated domain-containing protein n=1 Tax=Gossypium arboreum TaxID=29729 RepID=A0ABR0P772_GOSAR|nr:hypothetical protein PVK06_029623 [Gossypium arboreum]
MVDKIWMDAPRFSTNHLAGIERFLSFAIKKSLFNGKIYCPCHHCNNRILHEPHIVGKHLRLHGIIKEYKQWIFHGESIERTSVQTDQTVRTSPLISTCNNEADLRDLITDALGINIPTLNESFDGVLSEFQNNNREYDVNEAQRTAERETTLLDDCDIPLYPGCVKFSCVSFLLRLYHFKIDACPNDCMLYWGDASKKISCDVCKSLRWQSFNELDADEQVDGSCRCPKPAKLLNLSLYGLVFFGQSMISQLKLIFQGGVQKVVLLA